MATTPQLPRNEFGASSVNRFISLRMVVVFVGMFGIIAVYQFTSKAYKSEFGAHPDEAAHVVTGLMVHDYISNISKTAPMAFAEDYYLHYPKVALGHWPPVFYIVQAAWTTLLGSNHVSLLVLMAFTCCILCTMIFWISQKEFDTPSAASAAVVFAILPTVGMLTSSIMTELLSGLLSFSATIAFARYLATGGKSNRWSLAFALLASLAILTKGTGLLLVLVPPLSLLFSRRLDVFRRPSLWLSAVCVAILCAPFYLFTLKMQQNGMKHESFEPAFVAVAARFYGIGLIQVATVAAFIMAMIGVINRVILPFWRHSSIPPISASMVALLVSTLGFHVLVPCGLELRHLLPALPPLMFFMAAGLYCTRQSIDTISKNEHSQLSAMALSAFIISMVAVETVPYQKDWRGFREVVRYLAGDPMNLVTMISSDPRGEGMMIAEMALDDVDRPSRYIFRASKLLASSRWSGQDYQSFFKSPAEISNYLQSCSVDVLVFDTSIDPEDAPEHHRQIDQMLHAFKDKWVLVNQHSVVRNGTLFPKSLHVYRYAGPVVTSRIEIEIDMGYMLGRSLSAKNIRSGVRRNQTAPAASAR